MNNLLRNELSAAQVRAKLHEIALRLSGTSKTKRQKSVAITRSGGEVAGLSLERMRHDIYH